MKFASDPTIEPDVTPSAGSLNSDIAPEGLLIPLNGLSFVRYDGISAQACTRALNTLCAGGRFPVQLLVILRGELTVSESSGPGVPLAAHDMVLIDANGQTQFHSPQTIDLWAIGLAEPLVARWLHDTPTASARPLPGDGGWARVLSTYLRNWEAEALRRLDSPFEKEILAEHVMSLLSLALTQCGKASAMLNVPARDRGLYARMHQWIGNNYANPDLNVAKLAAQFGVSTRYVHKVFLEAARGETFLDAVRCARLKAAARLLRGTTIQTPVAEIAYGCGFSDPGYFGQVFRKAYGLSPKQFSNSTGATPEEAAPPGATAAHGGGPLTIDAGRLPDLTAA